VGMRKALLLLALGLAACNLQGLPGSGEEEGFQLLNADELRMTIRYGDGAPFEGRLRVLEAEAPVVGGRRKQLKNSPQIRTLFLFRSRFIHERKTSRRVAKEAKGVK
jgi:hypothetical protein